MPNLFDRFVAALERADRSTGCWLLPGRNPQLYNGLRANRNGFKHQLHRLAWEWWNGEALPDGMLVRHTCDTPGCFNPHHLLAGSHSTNAQDMLDRGRDNRWGWKGGRVT
jgi:hypothetical protein